MSIREQMEDTEWEEKQRNKERLNTYSNDPDCQKNILRLIKRIEKLEEGK